MAERVALCLERALPGAVSIADLQAALNPRDVPWFEATAANGAGVFETLKGTAKLVLNDLRQKMAG